MEICAFANCVCPSDRYFDSGRLHGLLRVVFVGVQLVDGYPCDRDCRIAVCGQTDILLIYVAQCCLQRRFREQGVQVWIGAFVAEVLECVLENSCSSLFDVGVKYFMSDVYRQRDSQNGGHLAYKFRFILLHKVRQHGRVFSL